MAKDSVCLELVREEKPEIKTHNSIDDWSSDDYMDNLVYRKHPKLKEDLNDFPDSYWDILND
jgi:hypothetical protein